MEEKLVIKGIDKLSTATKLIELKDKNGDVVDRQFITKVSFEAELAPGASTPLHHMLAAGARIDVIMGSAQSVFAAEHSEGVFAEPK